MPTAAEYVTRISALDWDGLADLWQAILQNDTSGWDSGKAFEYLILRSFHLDGAEVSWPYSVRLFSLEVEQIDGAVHCDGLSALVESKDYAENVSIAPIAKLRNQLLRRPAGTIGLMFSRSDFTDPARFLTQFTLPQAILLWKGEEVEYALQRQRIRDLLTLKYRICVEQGLSDYDVREGNIP